MATQHLIPTYRVSGGNRPFCQICRLLLPLIAMMTWLVWSQDSNVANHVASMSLATANNVLSTHLNGESFSHDDSLSDANSSDSESSQDRPNSDGSQDSESDEPESSALTWRKLATETEDSCHRFDFEMSGLIWLDQLKYATSLLNQVAQPTPDVSDLQRRQAAASTLGFELTGSLISSHVRLQI